MNKRIILTLLSVVLFSRKKDTSPIGKDVSIHYTGHNDSGMYEFRISNNSHVTGWYLGYGEGSPIYIVSVLVDTGWVQRGGWCGTGLYEVKLNPGNSFLIDVNKPANYKTWRVGIHIFYEFDREGEVFWSQVLR
jgi:hypothetical protein